MSCLPDVFCRDELNEIYDISNGTKLRSRYDNFAFNEESCNFFYKNKNFLQHKS